MGSKRRVPPLGVVPIDLLARAFKSRKRGRPPRKMLPTSPETPSDANVHPTQTPSTEDGLTKKRPRASDHHDSPPVTPTKKGRTQRDPSDGLTLPSFDRPAEEGELIDPSPSYTRWTNEYHENKGLFLTTYLDRDMVELPFISIDDVRPSSYSQKTPGITWRRKWLSPRKDQLGDAEGYEHKVMPIQDLVRFFDQYQQDWVADGHSMSRLLKVEWLDGPGLFPADIRSRRLSLSIDQRYHISNGDRLIWRVGFSCNNNCRVEPQSLKSFPGVSNHDPFATDLGTHIAAQRKLRATEARKKHAERVLAQCGPEDAEGEDYDEVESTPMQENQQQDMRLLRTDKCRAKVVVEMTVAQCAQGVCTVIRKKLDLHRSVPTVKLLKVSPYVRRLLHEAASGFGMTRDYLAAWYARTIVDTDMHAQWLLNNCPFRLPDQQDYRSAIITAQRRARLDKCPLAAIEIIHDRNPTAFLAANYPSILDDESSVETLDEARFECVVSSPHTLAVAMLQVPRMGLYMDSSWRNKNAHRCPLTLLVTINNFHRMLPMAAMVSNHADHIAYEYLLENFKRAIEELAQDIIDGRTTVVIDGVSQEDLEGACRVVLEDGLIPAFLMIDAADAERSALESAFPTVPIRVCQFHIMKGFKSRARAICGQMDDPLLISSKLMAALRRCQRCPSESEWSYYYGLFKAEVDQISGGKKKVWILLDDYLSRTWFSPRWIEYVVDYGIPSHVTRDGAWSTNNYSESAFRSFDRVFLGCRANRRLDRLISVLVTAYFPFYEQVPHTQSRPDPNLERHLFGGIFLWETDCIRPCPIASVPMAKRYLFGENVYCVYPARRSPKKTIVPHYCGTRPVNGRSVCTCDYHEQTGKRCSHLWAMESYALHGGVLEFDENIGIVMSRLGKDVNEIDEKEKEKEKGKEMIPEDDDEMEFEEFWGKPRSVTSIFQMELGGFDSHARDQQLARETAFRRADRVRNQASPVSHQRQPRNTATDASDSVATSPAVHGEEAADSEEILTAPIPPRHQANLSRQPTQGSNSAIPSTDLNRSDGPRIGEVSPIGRRHELAPSAEALFDFSSQSDIRKALVGRPAGIKPMEPYRTTHAAAKRSTLAIPSAVYQKLARPVGLRNSGVDCYALALFQVLLRQRDWNSAIYLASQQVVLKDDPIVQLLESIRYTIFGEESVVIDGLKQVLYDHDLVDSTSRMEDPAFLVTNLLVYFGKWHTISDLPDLLSVHIRSTFICPQCRKPSVRVRDAHYASSILVHPTAADDSQDLSDMVRTTLTDSAMLENTCERLPECGLTMGSQTYRSFHTSSPTMLINIVWNISDEANPKGTSNIRQFPIASRMTLIPFDPASAFPPLPVHWDLFGIVCRVGGQIDVGHYVAIIPFKDQWWVLDDHHCTLVKGSPGAEAFRKGRYPVLVLYERFREPSLLPPVPPVPTRLGDRVDTGTPEQGPAIGDPSGSMNDISDNSAPKSGPSGLQGKDPTSFLSREAVSGSRELDVLETKQLHQSSSPQQPSSQGSEVSIGADRSIGAVRDPTEFDLFTNTLLRFPTGPDRNSIGPDPSLIPGSHFWRGQSWRPAYADPPPESNLQLGSSSTTPPVGSLDQASGPMPWAPAVPIRPILPQTPAAARNLIGPVDNRVSVTRSQGQLLMPQYLAGSQEHAVGGRTAGTLVQGQAVRPLDGKSTIRGATPLVHPSIDSINVGDIDGLDVSMCNDMWSHFAQSFGVRQWWSDPDARQAQTARRLELKNAIHARHRKIIDDQLVALQGRERGGTQDPSVALTANGPGSAESGTALKSSSAPMAPKKTWPERLRAKVGGKKSQSLVTPDRSGSSHRKESATSDTVVTPVHNQVPFAPTRPSTLHEVIANPNTSSNHPSDSSEESSTYESAQSSPEPDDIVSITRSEARISRQESGFPTLSQSMAISVGTSSEKARPQSWIDDINNRLRMVPWEAASAPNVSLISSLLALKRKDSTVSDLPSEFHATILKFFERKRKNRLKAKVAPDEDKYTCMTIDGDYDLKLSELCRMSDPSEWRTLNMIDTCAGAALQQRANSRDSKTNLRQPVNYVSSLVSWPGRRPQLYWKRDERPWPKLGKDASWRLKTTVSTVCSELGHFIVIAIFGPQRIVIPFDGAGGSHDHEHLKNAWPTLLNNRLHWELDRGMVARDQNKGWLFGSNTPETRDHIGWIKQNDGRSCGPLAGAAAVMLLTGVRPSIGNLMVDSGDILDKESAIRLRHGLYVMILRCWNKVSLAMPAGTARSCMKAGKGLVGKELGSYIAEAERSGGMIDDAYDQQRAEVWANIDWSLYTS